MGCRVTDFILSRSLRSPETPPFIGLISISEERRKSAFEKSQAYLRSNPTRIENLFREFPYVSAWCVTQALSEAYGEIDQAIYRHIEDVLGVSLADQFHRRMLHKSFCLVCEKLGLPTRGFNRMVDVYLLHAGVPMPLLPALIRGFLRQEAAFGPPPTQATVMLNRWEDDSLDFLPHAVVTPRRAILWDETAWHATLYARIRQDPDAFVSKLPVEKCFFQTLLELQHNDGGVVVSLPKPRLVWRADGLAVRLPRVQGRVQIWQDDDPSPFRLRGGEDWTLPQPWPTLLQWRVHESEGAIGFLSNSVGLAVFDRTTGYLVKEVDGHSTEVEVDTTDAVILSRNSFSVDDEPALEMGESAFVAFSRLGASSIDLTNRKGVTQLRAKPRRRLTVRDGQIASGPRGMLYGPSAKVEVETGLERDEVRQLRVTVGQKTAEVEVEIVKGFAEIGIEALFASFRDTNRPDPLLMCIDLLAPAHGTESARISGISIRPWVWPAFLSSDGFVFDSDVEPKNLVLEQSQHVTQDSKGRLTLDSHGGYVSARAVFEIEGRFVPFDLPWPDVVVIRRRPDGSMLGLPMGARLTVDEENRFDTVTIRCPDTLATLIIRGRREDRPFARGLSRNLSVRDLLTAATDNRVILCRGSGAELLLFELVPSIEPKSFRPAPRSDGLRFYLKLMGPVDALALEIEDEHGATEFVEAGFGRRPVSSRRPSWLSVVLPNGDPTEIELTVSTLEFNDGLALARIFLRPDVDFESRSMWRPLRSSRGNTYAIVLGNRDIRLIDTELRRRFETLSRWLADCYAADCWTVIEAPLNSRWKEVGKTLAERPEGPGALMKAGIVPPPDHTARSWIPLLHPIHLLPDLYGAPTSAFASLSNSQDPGVAELANLFTLGRARLRDQSQLHATVYLAFRNRMEAMNENVQLRGFEPRTFFSNLPQVDHDSSAGWFWRGTPVLGPDHWRAAHLRFVERLEVAGMLTSEEAEASKISRRQEALLRLSREVWDMTPDTERPPVPLRSEDQEEPHSIDLWVAACLSAFGRASRMEEVDDFVAVLGQRLGWSVTEVLSTMALLLRLAPESFAFFLLTWQIAKDRP